MKFSFLRKLMSNKSGSSLESDDRLVSAETDPQDARIPKGDVVLIGRSIRRQVEAPEGMTILELAQKHEVDWNSNCKRGTCARCRCLVVDGREYLSESNEAELNRLEPEELEEGYRLACQTRIRTAGPVTVKYTPYF